MKLNRFKNKEKTAEIKPKPSELSSLQSLFKILKGWLKSEFPHQFDMDSPENFQHIEVDLKRRLEEVNDSFRISVERAQDRLQQMRHEVALLEQRIHGLTHLVGTIERGTTFERIRLILGIIFNRKLR